MSVREIARRTGCTVNRIYYMLRKKPKKKRVPEEYDSRPTGYRAASRRKPKA